MDRIRIYYHPNPQIRSFLLPRPISPPVVEHLKRPLDAIPEDGFQRLGHIAARVAKDLFGIQEIREIRMKPKEILITKEEEAMWDDLEGRIFAILEVSLRRKGMRIVKR